MRDRLRLLVDRIALAAAGQGVVLALVSLALTSCADLSPRLSHDDPVEGRPTRFRQVATIDAMPSSTPEIYASGPEIKGKMLKLIESAEDYILIDSFLLTNEPSSRPVLEALRNKHRSGVRIHVMADSSSRFTGREAGFDFLQQAGIPHAEYNPMHVCKVVVAPLMLPRDHRKFWIVDGKVLFLGSANITATSLDPLEKGGNHDLMMAVESPRAIAAMIHSFIDTWNWWSPRRLRPEDFQVAAGRSTPETDLWLFDQNHPERGDRAILELMDCLFSIAEKEVWLVQPYTFVTPGLLQRIRYATKRGVEVNLVLSGRFHADRFHHASYYGIEDIIRCGGKVWIYEAGEGVLHAKAFVIDDRCISIGSANLNHRSYRLSKETNLVFDDPGSARRLAPIIERIKSKCRPVSIEEARRHRTPWNFLTWLAMHVMG